MLEMSGMDTWSRPRKTQAVPAPFYSSHPQTQYCHTCGRLIGSRRSNAAKANVVKYCSERCKRHKPSNTHGSVEKRIEHALIELLEGRIVIPSSEDEKQKFAPVKAKFQPKKGDPRIMVQLSEVEEAVFGNRQDPDKIYGRRRNRAKRGVPDAPEWKSVDMMDEVIVNEQDASEITPTHDNEEDDNLSLHADDSIYENELFETNGTTLRIRPPQMMRNVDISTTNNNRTGEKVDETPEMQQRRLAGVKKAEEKEIVRQVARRAVVFGLPVAFEAGEPQNAKTEVKKKHGRNGGHEEDASEPGLRKCEALMHGIVVDPSFAKGDWAIRRRE